MDKPQTPEELIQLLWIMLAGVNDDGMYYEFKHLMKLVSDFISNAGSVRFNSCPIKIQLENHLIEHEKSKLISKDKKEFKLKKWQVAFAGFGVCVAIALGILNFIK